MEMVETWFQLFFSSETWCNNFRKLLMRLCRVLILVFAWYIIYIWFLHYMTYTWTWAILKDGPVFFPRLDRWFYVKLYIQTSHRWFNILVIIRVVVNTFWFSLTFLVTSWDEHFTWKRFFVMKPPWPSWPTQLFALDLLSHSCRTIMVSDPFHL